LLADPNSLRLKDENVQNYMLPLILSVTLREKQKLRTFEKSVVGGIFRPKSEEVAAGWRRLHSEELHNLYAL